MAGERASILRRSLTFDTRRRPLRGNWITSEYAKLFIKLDCTQNYILIYNFAQSLGSTWQRRGSFDRERKIAAIILRWGRGELGLLRLMSSQRAKGSRRSSGFEHFQLRDVTKTHKSPTGGYEFFFRWRHAATTFLVLSCRRSSRL